MSQFILSILFLFSVDGHAQLVEGQTVRVSNQGQTVEAKVYTNGRVTKICRGLKRKSKGTVIGPPNGQGEVPVSFASGACKGEIAYISQRFLAATGGGVGGKVKGTFQESLQKAGKDFRRDKEDLKQDWRGTKNAVVEGVKNFPKQVKEDVDELKHSTEAGECVDCKAKKQPGPVEENAGGIVEAVTGSNPINFKALFKGGGLGRCRQFVRKNGGLGPKGRMVLAEIKKYPNCFDAAGSSPGADLCPGYLGFDKSQREHFWVYAMAAISKEKSGCSNKRRQGDENWRGLFDLPEKWKDRANLGYDPQTCSVASGTDVSTETFQVACAVGTLKHKTCSKGSGAFSKTIMSWGNPFDANNEKILRHIRDFPGCAR